MLQGADEEQEADELVVGGLPGIAGEVVDDVDVSMADFYQRPHLVFTIGEVAFFMRAQFQTEMAGDFFTEPPAGAERE